MKLVSKVCLDPITKSVANNMDFAFGGEVCFKVPEIAIPPSFQIGVVVGPSGSGKTSGLKAAGLEDDAVEWRAGFSVASHFSNEEEALQKLSAAGLNSVPSMLKPYEHLSNGEKFRADLARKIKNGRLIDEFTSVVDRVVARSASHSMQRYIRKSGLCRVVFSTCHYDVIDWLKPDWVFDTAQKAFVERGSERRTSIQIEVKPCTRYAWALFRDHHYLSGDINPSARCWLATWDDRPVGFTAALAYPVGGMKNCYRGHRTVVLPDYQGLGIGVRLSDCVGEILTRAGYRYFSKTSHRRMGEYRNASDKWRPTAKNMMVRKDYKSDTPTKESGHKLRHADRFCYSHEYVGAGRKSEVA